MDTLPANMLAPALWVAVTLLTTAFGIIAYFLKDIRSDLKQQQRDQDERIKKVADDLSGLKESLPRQYVLRDDFIRAISGLDNKIDNISKEMKEISRGLSLLIGGNK